jgi:hypothetical protein
MNKVTRLIGASALFGGAAAAEAQTYDFTATVTSSSGLFESVRDGSSITGSFSVDLGEATSGAIADLGSTTVKGSAISAGGISLGTPAPDGFVFSSTVKTGIVPFSSGSPGYYYTNSYFDTSPANGDGTETVTGFEITATNPFVHSESFVVLQSSDAFSQGGLPTLTTGAGTKDTGGFAEDIFGFNSSVSYDITSLKLAPSVTAPEVDPAHAASALTLVIGGLLVISGRRRLLTSATRDSGAPTPA